MPTYKKIYVAIPRIGSGRDDDNAFRPDFIGESGTPSQWPRHSKVWTVFGKHPTHVIAGVETERAVLDDLRSKPGVRFLGNTIGDARSDMAVSLSSFGTDGRAALQTVYDRNPARYSLLGPSPVFLINEPVISPPGWRDSEVVAMLAAKPANWPRQAWIHRVRAYFTMNHLDVQRLLGGRTAVISETFSGSQANWSDASESYSFLTASGTTPVRTQTGGEGIVTRASGGDGTEIEYVVLDPLIEDSDVHCVYDATQAATRPGLVSRFLVGPPDYYFVQFLDPTTAGADLKVQVIDNGGNTLLAEDLNIGPIDPGELRMNTTDAGADTQILAKAWSGAEPGGWNITVSTSVLDEQTGSVGLRTRVAASTARAVHYDGWDADDLAVGNGADVRSHIVPAYYRVNA